MLNFTGSTGYKNQYAPFCFITDCKTFDANFYHDTVDSNFYNSSIGMLLGFAK